MFVVVIVVILSVLLFSKYCLKRHSRLVQAVIFEAARMIGILITFMQIATSTQEIFSGVTFPVNLLVYLKVMGFVNLD